ncbi:type II secretion protein GspC [Escherichia coli]|nr:type II secretion protein GspC [Escherichia coli]
MLLIISAKMAHSLWRYISFSAEYTAVSQPVNKPSRVDAKTFDKNDVQLISQQNWFGKYQPVAAQVKQPEPVPVAETRLNVVLRGIAFGARPGAVIEEGGKQQVYLQGETLGSHNAVIEEINRDHVMLRYQGKIERLSLAEEERSTVAVTNKKPSVTKQSKLLLSLLSVCQLRSRLPCVRHWRKIRRKFLTISSLRLCVRRGLSVMQRSRGQIVLCSMPAVSRKAISPLR